MAAIKIQETKSYTLFHRSTDNRPLDLKKHARLMESMRKYGFLKSFPVIVVRDANGRLVLKDGQHRVAIAESLGLSVFYVEEKIDFDVAEVNCAAKTWVPKDYAMKHAANGLKDYQEALEFAERFGLPVLAASSLLAGIVSGTNIAFYEGRFKIKDRKLATEVASLYVGMAALSPKLKKHQFMHACMSVCRVPGFDANRMLGGAERCREKLVSYGTCEAFLGMMEEIYNFGRKTLVPLKMQAAAVMRARNPSKKNSQ